MKLGSVIRRAFAVMPALKIYLSTSQKKKKKKKKRISHLGFLATYRKQTFFFFCLITSPRLSCISPNVLKTLLLAMIQNSVLSWFNCSLF